MCAGSAPPPLSSPLYIAFYVAAGGGTKGNHIEYHLCDSSGFAGAADIISNMAAPSSSLGAFGGLQKGGFKV